MTLKLNYNEYYFNGENFFAVIDTIEPLRSIQNQEQSWWYNKRQY